MIIIVMGVSGSGKTSVGGKIAERLGCGFSDADSFHSAANKAKMAAGTPLTDDDRWPWLDAMRAAIVGHIAAGETYVFACSALRRVYRDRLRKDVGSPDAAAFASSDTAQAGIDECEVLFVYLSGSFSLLEQRLARRANHFFDPALLKSQVDTLEPPGADEAVTIDITPPVPEIVEQALVAIRQRTSNCGDPV